MINKCLKSRLMGSMPAICPTHWTHDVVVMLNQRRNSAMCPVGSPTIGPYVEVYLFISSRLSA